MVRTRVALAVALGTIALWLCSRRLDARGLWYDEAYSARLAALELPRMIAGAGLDVHPPGWPMICWAFLRLPLESEVALRLPSTLSFAALTVLLAARSPLAAACVLLYAPLVDQSAQGRPYATLALALTAFVACLHRGWFAAAGATAGVATSLHALGGALVVAAAMGSALSRRPDARELLAFSIPFVLLVAPWLPDFVVAALAYVGNPWYTPAPRDWLYVTDGFGGIVGLIALFVLERRLVAFAPVAVVAAGLLVAEIAGIGVEIRKVGVVLLPLALVSTRSVPGLCGCALGLWATSVEVPVRPDLREARAALAGHDGPIVAVFASEASWYFRNPAPLPATRDPSDNAVRIGRALERHPCVASVLLPGTFPDVLPVEVRVEQLAVTGLDVRVVCRGS